MNDTKVTDSILYIGADDKTIDLFESQYVVPNGISYNSYVILDEKVAVMDTVDARKTDEWLANLDSALGGRDVDYLVVSHMEPDHASNIQALAEKFPGMQVVGNAKTFSMISQFFDIDLSGRSMTVKEGDSLSLGSHTLTFYMAPRVHWPEVMATYESSEKVFFLRRRLRKVQAAAGHRGGTGPARRDATISISWANTAPRCRHSLRRRRPWTSRSSARCTAPF